MSTAHESPLPVRIGPKRNWFDRNWKWFVPLACLWGLAVMGAVCLFVVYLAFGVMKTSDVYREALARAKASPGVVRSLGEPLREGLFVSGSIQVTGPSGNAELAIPLSGPRGKGTIYLEARKSAGRWNYSRLLVEVTATGERIDLLKPGEAQVPAEPESHKGSDTVI